jgi:hypothetical protein
MAMSSISDEDWIDAVMRAVKKRRKMNFDNACEPKIHSINNKRRKITSDIITDGKKRKGFNKRKNRFSTCSDFDEFY